MYNSQHLTKYTIAQLNCELQLRDSKSSMYRIVMAELDKRYKAHYEKILAQVCNQIENC